ncbi:MAG: methyltransferase domain-containing protein [Bacteroidales bacterium]|nr:methyltransferase domain-containing protein [Bacteroidales bacterium]
MTLNLFNIFITIGRYRHYCTICGKYVRHFLDNGTQSMAWEQHQTTGGSYRFDRCPHCGSYGRTRMIKMFLQEGKRFENKDILHIAPEQSLRTWLQEHNCRYTAIDKKSGYYIDRYDDGVQNGDITALDFPDVSFDIIICSHVLEHVDDDSKAISEMYRVLRPGGVAICQVPLAVDLERTIEAEPNMTAEERFNLFGHDDHKRLYGKDYFARLEQGGFMVTPLHFDVNCFKHGLEQEESLIVCHK